jgi:hypothetical protein
MNGRGLLMRLVTSKKGISVHTKVRYAFLNLTMGPASLDTQKMARMSETQNCNGMFQNTRIVITLLQLYRIVMASIKKPSNVSISTCERINTSSIYDGKKMALPHD